MVWLELGAALALFSAVTWMAWIGKLGFLALALLFASFVPFWLGRRALQGKARERIDQLAKLLFTVAGVMALLRHPVETGDGGAAPLYYAVADHLSSVDVTVFVVWGLVAMGVKLVGVLTSAYAWHLLLRGQGLKMPFWQSTMTAFLIGRFIGTFLPSTLGLDGYTLYEATRYTHEPARTVTAKTLEKFIGITGLFLGMVLTMPVGYSVIVGVTQSLGRPEAAPLLALAILLVAGGISAGVILTLVWPVHVVRLADAVLAKIGQLAHQGLVQKVVGMGHKLTDAVGAYHGKLGLLMLALLSKFITHFTTFAVYYFTGLAIGVTGLAFWPVVFGSSIQVLATVLSPTIAGEGAREAFQSLLLASHYGGPAQAVLSGALGFIAAEAATLWGGAFLWTRTPQWRPRYCEVDGVQVDYAWLDESAANGENPSA